MRTLINYALYVVIGLQIVLASTAYAHKPSDSFLILTAHKDQSSATAQLDIALRDLDFAIGLDRDGNDQITWKELRNAQTAITSYALSRISIKADQQTCHPTLNALMVDHHVDGSYAVLNLNTHCPVSAAAYSVHYRLFFDIDHLHKNILVFQHNDFTDTTVLSADQNSAHLLMNTPHAWKQWLNFVQEGIWHIWQGFDHILFIVSLLLPAVMVSRHHKWYPAESLKSVIKDAVGIITAFTLSHSITLSLATFKLVNLPSRWVESVIALSVMAAALNNLYPIVHRKRWVMTFIFGLIHGFGFASNLLELELPPSSLLRSVLGFNVGVEIGQLVIVLLMLPLAFSLRKQWAYLNIGLRAGSVLITFIAGAWFIERVFNLQWMPF
ncbi:MAG: HupE/UreJ family protein [Pseudomonadota bacterium]